MPNKYLVQISHYSLFTFHFSFFILHSSFLKSGRAPREYMGRAFGTASTKPPPAASADLQSAPAAGGGFVADRECLYPSRSTSRIRSVLWHRHRILQSKGQVITLSLNAAFQVIRNRLSLV